ncbi:MAG: site-specific DNA-methyltransferase [Thermodesulfobacteriota bacterium]
MAKARKSNKKPIEQYDHKGKKRVNNPPVGLVTPELDQEKGKKLYAFDPHLDPQLQWAGKAEHISFEVPTVSLHVHERIDPRTIIESVRKKNGTRYDQMSLFSAPEENPPLREAIEFYKHPHNWSNRLIAGDSLLVMNSLLEKEGLAGKVQMIYIDPPYGIRYKSNFQPFVNKRDVKDKDEDLNQEPEMIKAFRDTWELGIHSYLNNLRDRVLLARELLSESGSIFVQISDENVHYVRELMDEVFGRPNFLSIITFQKTGATTGSTLSTVSDYLIQYSKNKENVKYRQLFYERSLDYETFEIFPFLEDINGKRRRITEDETKNPGIIISKNLKLFQTQPLHSQHYNEERSKPWVFKGKKYEVPNNRQWATSFIGLERLASLNRIEEQGNTIRFVRYLKEAPAAPISNLWNDTSSFSQRIYSVQTNDKVIQRCLLMTTDPGDLILDITCGSGTSAYAAEQWGRRWITCDTSRVAITLAKQRLMTSLFDYYDLAYPEQGVGSGFKYKTVPHITLKSIADNEPPAQEVLYDQPLINHSLVRVTGPFTVEAVPAPIVKPLYEIETEQDADESIARSGETLRQAEWRDELFRTGIRGKGGQKILFSRIEPFPGTFWLHADGETKEYNPQRVAVSFGPEHAPLEKKQVEQAIQEARKLVPKPTMIVFASFQFDPEAAKDIDETNWPGVVLIKAQMNTDLLTEDLKKKRSSNESFWLIGQPEIRLKKIKDKKKEKCQVEVMGFDYYNTKTGTIDSGGPEKIAMWMLDTDYDGRCLFPKQVFFPMAGEKEGWARLAKNLKAEIDDILIEAYRGTVSLPFEAGDNKKIAVKIIDDRGIESLKIIEVG